MYDLDSLIKTFAKHGEQSEQDKARLLEEYKREFPGEEIPAHMLDPFNICFALHSMAMEIKKLKESVR